MLQPCLRACLSESARSQATHRQAFTPKAFGVAEVPLRISNIFYSNHNFLFTG
ncbi:MAG: hypothetical protein Q8K98_14475 [Bacteroidota bacterium]|nr:hypothetical protein [Bacteroidota bacterium]